MIGWSRTGSGPEKLAIGFENRNIVDAGLAASHQAALVELPQFVAIAAVPLTGGIVPLVLKSHGDPVVGECPQGFDQAVIEFAIPLAGQEFSNLVAADDELATVPPDRIFGVGQGNTIWIARIPGVFG